MLSNTQTAKERTEHDIYLKGLMLRVAEDRDRQAFSLLFDHFVPLIRAFSLARDTGSALLADELAQEVIIKIWAKAHTYKPELSRVNTWVYTLARNSRIDQLRRDSKHKTNIDSSDIFSEIEDEAPGPFQVTQQQQIEQSIHQNLKQLPPEQSEVLVKV